MAKLISGFEPDQLPDNLREFDDSDTARKWMSENVMEALSKRFPMEDDKHRLELTNLKFDGPEEFSWADQKRAMLTDRTLRTPIKGTWKLTDVKTGARLDEKEDVVMHLPYWTDRGTLVRNGADFSCSNQSRLKAGVYTRTKKSGEHEAQFNVTPGTGTGFRLWLEPETGIFRVNVGQANIPAYQFLKTLGVQDKDMEAAWGPDLMEKNMARQDSKALEKLYDRFVSKSAPRDIPDNEKAEVLKTTVAGMAVDPWVIERTLGMQNQDRVTPGMILRTSRKLLNVNRGDEQEDNRDAPEFSNVLSVEDFVKERIDKDAGRTARQLLWKIRRTGNLQPAGRGVLNPYMDSLIYNSGLVQHLEETNPLNALDLQHKQTKFGEGGLGDEKAVTDEARDVSPGQIGFIDPIATPESLRVGTETHFAYKTFKGRDKQIYAEFIDNRTGKKAYLRPEDMTGKVLAFPGQKDAPEQYALANGEMRKVPAEEVDYTIPSLSHMFNPTINLTPMPTGFMPGRAVFSAKYWSQFLPVIGGETPFVQAQVPGTDKSFSEYYGRRCAAINSKVGGVVTRVSDANITITDEDGRKHVVETVKDFPHNRMTAVSYESVVKAGDVVKPGDLLAKSNFTDDKGTLNMGRNLKVCVVPARGRSYEDSWVISESAAEKLRTQKLYGYDVDKRRGVKIHKGTFISAFPKVYTNEQLDRLDEDGVVKPGTQVNKGDPLILAIGPRVLSAEDAKLGRLHKVLRRMHNDESQVWPYEQPGIVTDVALTARGAKVNVKSEGPVQKGDKVVNLHSSKGIVGEILGDDEMPRDPRTNEPYEVMFNPMTVLSRIAPNQLVEMNLGKVAKLTGKPYILPQEAPEEGWAEFARRELEKHGVDEKADVYDPKTGKTVKSLGDGYTYVLPFHHLAEKKLCVTLDTEFETTDGWVKGSDIRPRHKFRTVNPRTGEESFQFPSAINFYNMDGQAMYHVEDEHADLLVTATHRVVVDASSVPFRIELAEQLHHLNRRGLL